MNGAVEGKKLLEDDSGLLIFIVVFEVVLKTVKQIDLGTEEIKKSLGCRRDALFLQFYA